MQKTCLNCAHVGVCSKRMQFIVNNYLVKRHYNEIENVSKTLDMSVNWDSYAEKDFFSFICARVRDYSDGEVWSDGDQILCKTESAANALCDLLWQLYNERGEAFDLHTGYYDPKETSPILQVGKNGSTRFPTGCPTSLDSVIWGSMSVMTTSENLRFFNNKEK